MKKLLQKLLRNEEEHEKMRLKLQKRQDFDINMIFESVDKEKKGFLNCEDFKKVLNKYGVFSTKSELKGLLRRFDRDEDGKVTLEEFIKEIKTKLVKKSYFL